MEALINEFEDMCKNAAAVQEEVLGTIVEHNASCEFLQSYNVTDADSFKAHVPVVGYEDIAVKIHRMTDGDPASILCKDPVLAFISRDFPVGCFPTALAFMHALPCGTLSKSGIPIMPVSNFGFTS
ncbi:probable indole-3-acetic acid-amido synthetase GH3.1 [Selaginella moellendorffii]|uniref:probable indole-3-acetic acid-amido synthetase GH3.1 n=1 Tax=Selaginella moellendorffii TaxID=88036 RepID=UPI000D1D05D3|nr:probable indole-3-acetic acid-amido synthetase GH3.1 [Selaginella moellendorffii]|eukprot:XP_024516762.1 probable indole-3-acetic acid-amido synthetase GH3.1 [Selaginella moellendorffii]